jgi:hypothetical protein
MMEEAEVLKTRNQELDKDIVADHKKYFNLGRTNYYWSQFLSWTSVLCGAAAGLLGLIPSDVQKWQVGASCSVYCNRGGEPKTGTSAKGKLALQES